LNRRFNMSSILKTIISLKNTLVNLSADNWDRLNALTGDLQIGESITVPTGQGFYGVFTKTADEYQTVIKDKIGTQLGSVLHGSTFEDIITNDTIFTDLEQSAYTSVNELVSGAASDAQIYDILAIITDGYKTNTRQSVDAITTSLLGHTSDNATYNEMISDIAGLADDQGLVSNTAWLAFIQSICNKAKENLGSGGFNIDNSAPMYINCLWTTIAAEALPVIGEIIQWVASCIGGIIGIIGVVIGAIVSFVGRLFGQVVRPEYTAIDADANTPLLKEVPFALTPQEVADNNPHGQKIVIESDLVQSGQVMKYDCGFIEHYMWPNKVINRVNDADELKPLQTDLCFNSFISFKLNPIKTINWLYNNLIIVEPNQDHEYGFKFRDGVDNFWTIPQECEWSLDEIMRMQQGDSAMIQASAWCAWICLSLALLNVSDYQLDYLYLEDNDNFMVNLDDYMRYTGVTKQQYEKGVVACGISAIQYIYRQYRAIIDASFDNLDGVYPDGSNFPTTTCESLTTLIYILNQRSLVASSAKTQVPQFDDLFQAYSKYEHNIPLTPNLPRFDLEKFYWNPMWHFFTVGAPRYPEWDEYYHQVGESTFIRPSSRYNDIMSVDDFIPTARAFRCENTTWSEVIWTIVATATIMVAGIVVGAVVKSKLKRRKLRKRMDATKAMNDATDKYNKGQIDFNTYYKQLKSYNRKARWFGYPSYDPCNKWFDYGSATEKSSDSMDISKITNLISGQ